MGRAYAAADIGSNTAHILIAEVKKSGEVKRLLNESDWLSLGELVMKEGRIPKIEANRLVETLRRFKRHAKRLDAQPLYVFATEAMRRAENCDDMLARIKDELGLEVDLLPGPREAELGLKGSLTDTDMADPCAFLEVGGGSIQAARVSNGKILGTLSLPLGTGTLIARSGLEQPTTPQQIAKLRGEIAVGLGNSKDLGHAASAVACGGVARGLWRALHPDGEPVLHVKELSHLAWDVKRLTAEQIVDRYGVKPKRAKTLLPGAMVFVSALELLGLETITISRHGVREGAILEMASTSCPTPQAA